MNDIGAFLAIDSNLFFKFITDFFSEDFNPEPYTYLCYFQLY